MDHLNLVHDRGDGNVWEDTTGLTSRLRTLDPSRTLIVAGGAAMAALGLRQRGVLGALLTATGGLLVYRALSGHDDVSTARAWGTSQVRDRGWVRPDDVDETVAESFPASDPPSH